VLTLPRPRVRVSLPRAAATARLDQALIRDKRWKNLSLLSISRNRQR
jgi:septum formation inhibitor-activating ATPase MinD